MSKKKKQATPPLNPPLTVATLSVPPVALLIDGENTIIPELVAHILVEAGKMGGVTVRQVYGNWAAPSMQPWKKYMEHYALEQMGNRSGRNATDIALVIGAMDLLYRGIKHFCLVAGDSDYVPLVVRLRESGCTVLVIGTSAVSGALKEASSIFLSTDQLLPRALPQASPVSVAAPAPPLALSTLLKKAYCAASKQYQTEWISFAQLGSSVREICPTFEQTYGKSKISTRVKQCSDCFETRQRESGKGQVEEVRLRQPHV